MEGTGEAYRYSTSQRSTLLASGGCSAHQRSTSLLAPPVVEPSSPSSISPTSPSPLIQCQNRGYGDTAADLPHTPPHQLHLSEASSDGDDYKPPTMSTDTHTAPHTQPSDSPGSLLNHPAAQPPHVSPPAPLPSHSQQQQQCPIISPAPKIAPPGHSHQQQQCPVISPPEIALASHSQQLQSSAPSPPPSTPCILDPNAREFTPSLLPSLPAMHAPVMQPVYTSHSEITVSVCYQTNVAAMQGSCNYELVDTSLRLGLPSPAMASSEIVTATDNMVASPNQCTPSPCESLGHQFAAYAGRFPEEYMGVRHHVGGGSYSVEDALHMGSIGILASVHGRPPMPAINPPILANPSSVHHVGFLPAMPMRPPLPPPPMPPCRMHISCSDPPGTHPQQALTVYTHKHFHPHYGWKEHISRAILISGIPSHLSESQLCEELEQWGHIRALLTDKLSQGMLSVHFFDLRASRQALRDMQNQHLLRQQRFQQHLYAKSGMQFHSCRLQSGADGEGLMNRGLLCGNVVWAQYVAAWSVSVHDGHNQGTLVLFNVGTDVDLQELRQVFEKYGDVRELREAPTKRQHKFVEFYDTRDAEAAWAALNGQEVCGKCVKIEFSRQGGPARKQKSASIQAHHDLVAIGNAGAVLAHGHMSHVYEAPNRDPVSCGWQNHSSNGIYQQEWRVGSFQGDSQPFPRPDTIMLPNALLGADNPAIYGSSRCTGQRYVSGAKGSVNHMQGAVAGPRRKQSGVAKPHLKVCHAVVQPTDKSYALTYDSRRIGAIPRNASTRGHPHFEYDEREVYLISGQQRTTLMIKNIPNKYSQQMLLSWLDHHCVDYNSRIVNSNEPDSAYDFVYLPIDFKNRCNLGYAFVNFTTALATLKFYKAFHAQAWEAFNSKKICEIKYARVQGRTALENHFCNSRFACDTVEYLPVVFVPPRNGLECPQPRVAAGLMVMKSGRQCFGTARVMFGSASSGEERDFTSQSKPLPEIGAPHEKPPSDCDSTSASEDESEKLESDEIYVNTVTTSAHA